MWCDLQIQWTKNFCEYTCIYKYKNISDFPSWAAILYRNVVLISLTHTTDLLTCSSLISLYCWVGSLRQSDSLTVRQSDSLTVRHSDRPTVRQSDSPTVWQSDSPTVRHSDSPAVWQSDSLTVRQSDSPTVRQSDSPAVRQSDSPTVWQSDSPAVWQSDSLTVRQSDSPTVRQSDSPTVWQSDSPTVGQSDSLTVRQSDSLLRVELTWQIPFLSFFLSLLVWNLLHSYCSCSGLLLHLVTLNDARTHKQAHTHEQRTHTYTHSTGLLWTRDRPVAQTSTRQHTTLTTDRQPCPRRNSNPQSQ